MQQTDCSKKNVSLKPLQLTGGIQSFFLVITKCYRTAVYLLVESNLFLGTQDITPKVLVQLSVHYPYTICIVLKQVDPYSGLINFSLVTNLKKVTSVSKLFKHSIAILLKCKQQNL